MHALSAHALDRATSSATLHRHSCSSSANTPHAQRASTVALHTARHTTHTLALPPHQTHHSEAHLDLSSASPAQRTTTTTHATHPQRELYQLADSSASAAAHNHAHKPLAELAATNPAGLAAAAAALGLSTFGLVKLFNRGSRSYSNNVGQE